MKRLIVNADDFGMTAGINRGIIDCHRQGVVTSTTLLVNGEAAREAAGLAADNPDLGVGLHLNLTSGAPSSPAASVPSLVDRDGLLPGVRRMVMRLSTGAVRRAELEAEIAAQLEACRALGVEPTHVDSHHHLHAHPVVRAALARVCPAAGIRKARGFKLAPRSFKALGIRLAAALPWPGGRMVTPERLAGIEEMGKKDITVALKKELDAAGGTLEYMCHPGYLDERLRQVTTYNQLREVELRALQSRELAEMIGAAGVELVNFELLQA